MLDASFIEKIVALAAVDGIELDGRHYTTKPVHPALEPEAARGWPARTTSSAMGCPVLRCPDMEC